MSLEEVLPECKWVPAYELGVSGLGWSADQLESPFDRLPAKAKATLNDRVWWLSTNAAGVYVSFRSNAEEIFVRWSLDCEVLDAAPKVARYGIDTWGKACDGRWYWVGQREPWAFPDCHGRAHQLKLDGADREYRIYFPMGERVTRLEVGVAQEFHLEPVANDPRKPIAYYGTSIVHGAGVQRSAAMHAQQLGRRLDREVLNLGFMGMAKCEAEMVDLLVELDPCLFILDPIPNMSPELILERLPELLKALRAARPKTPILALGDRNFGDAMFLPHREAEFTAKARAMAHVIQQCKDDEMPGLHSYQPASWFGDGEALGVATQDGSHPNELGAWMMVQQLEPLVRRLIG